MKLRHVLLASVAVLAPVWAQQFTGERDTQTIRRDMDELIKGQIELQKQLQEIKSMLQGSQACPQAPQPNITFNIAGAPLKGNPQATVTMIEFTDYQCPFCARYDAETFPQIEHDYIKPGRLRYVFRDFPLENMHPAARKAAEAARCAADGGAFWEMHERLFANQTNLVVESFSQYAQLVGLDATAFRRCLVDGQHAPVVSQEMADASRAGVTGTPTFFIGLTGTNAASVKVVKVIVGHQPYATFKSALDAVLTEAR